jgi:hypothetical protein
MQDFCDLALAIRRCNHSARSHPQEEEQVKNTADFCCFLTFYNPHPASQYRQNFYLPHRKKKYFESGKGH